MPRRNDLCGNRRAWASSLPYGLGKGVGEPSTHFIRPDQFMTRSLSSATAALATLLSFAAPAQAIPQCGSASWYALRSRTASGEMMNPSAMTAAHRSLPFGTKVRVTNKRNGKAVIVRINDRGPFIKGRIIDLSEAAARELGFVRAGHTKICLDRH